MAVALVTYDDNPNRWEVVFSFDLEEVIVDSNLHGALVQLKGHHLIVHELPIIFRQRYGDIPREIFVRECYEDLYRIVTEQITSGFMDYGVTLFTGIPGIGKSLFLVYFLYRFLHDDRFEDKKFALEFTSNEYVTFEPTADSGKFMCSCLSGRQMFGKDFPVFCDISALQQPRARQRWLLIFSGLDPQRFKEVIKNSPAYRYVMPTWSPTELRMMMAGNTFWFKFLVLHGVPKLNPDYPSHSLTTSSLKATTKLADCDGDSRSGGATAEIIGWFSFGIDDQLQKCLLVHPEPPPPNYGEFDYNKAAVNTSYVYSSTMKLKAFVKTQGRAQMPSVAFPHINFGGTSNADSGKLFEMVCRVTHPLDGLSITASSLEVGGEDITFDVPIEQHSLQYDWKKTGGHKADLHIVPRISNLEAGNGFFAIQCDPSTSTDNHNYWLVVIQFTVKKLHPVKVNGLHEIIFSFAEDVKKRITRKVLLFVTPECGELNEKQMLINYQFKEVVDLPLAVQGFEQYVFRHTV